MTTKLHKEVFECGGCGRVYPIHFNGVCPFCYVQEFLEVEATDGNCPVCGEVHRSVCPECDKKFGEHDTYCLYCGFIRNQPMTASDEMKAKGY